MISQTTSFIIFIALPLIIFFGTDISLAQQEKTIIAFGDSITAGYGEVANLTPGDRVGGYEPDLETLTDIINNHYDVLNYGLGGEKTGYDPDHPEDLGGLDRLRYSVLPAQRNASYILILEGTNDIFGGISRETTIYLLGEMIRYAKSYGITPILGTLTPDTRTGIANLKDIPVTNDLIRQLASQKNVALADFYPQVINKWNSVYSQSDQLHPSRAGYEKIASIWFETLALPIHRSPAPWSILLLK